MVVVAAASTAVAAKSAHDQGVVQAATAKEQALTDQQSLQQKELDRRRQLVSALASQNAAAGAYGVQTDGSLGASMNYQISQEQQDALATSAGASATSEMLTDQGRNAMLGANATAAGDVASGITKTYSLLS
jgi:hypothetical protein